MLATCVDTTVDRNERKRQLKDRGEQLERRRDEFGTLDHINAVVRDVNKSLAQAASRDEIERLVCERLAASDSYRPAWIGRYDVETETVEPVATAGLTPEALAPVRFDGAASTPLATAVVERSAQFVQDRSLGVETDGGIQWSPGPRSFAYVPLVHRSFLHGVLAVAAAGPDAVGDRERAVLDELGKSIGAAIGAAQRKRALFAPDAVELEFEIASEDSFLVELSSDIDGPLEVDRILETTRDALRLVVTAPGLNDDGVDAVASRSTTVRSIHSVEGHEMGYEVTVERSPLFDYLLEHGIILGGMVAEDGRCRATLELPDTADVRRCVSLVESAYGRASMVARRERPDGSTSERFRATVPDRLTDRQREVLRTAHEAGFFHWPREHTGEELAARLGITQSTFLEHLRTSERRVFEVLFGAGD
jgi:predicted DNA binding protein